MRPDGRAEGACAQRLRNLAAPPSPRLPTASPAAEHPDDPLRNLYIQHTPPTGILFVRRDGAKPDV